MRDSDPGGSGPGVCSSRWGRVWAWLEDRYEDRLTWCAWCQDLPTESGSAFCSNTCGWAHGRFEADLGTTDSERRRNGGIDEHRTG